MLARAGHPANLMNLPVRQMVHSLACQTTVQPYSATLYGYILQEAQQPNLAFVQVPPALFVLNDRASGARQARTASAGAKAVSAAAGSAGHGKGAAKAAAAQCAERVSVTYEQARLGVQAELLTIGYVSHSDGRLHLNPPESSCLLPGDTLVGLTAQAGTRTAGASARRWCMALRACRAVLRADAHAAALACMHARTQA